MASDTTITIATTPTTILSPTNENTMNAIKRKSPATEPSKKTTVKKSKTTATGTNDATTRNCHQCHRAQTDFVLCTLKRTKGKKTERCGKVFCDGCLKRHYNTGTTAIKAKGKVKDLTQVLGHDASDSYYFKCPVCENKCMCYQHRKKEPEGQEAGLQAFAKEAGVPVAEVTEIMNGSMDAPPKEVKPKEVKPKEVKPKEKKPKETKPKEPKEKKPKEKKEKAPKEKKPAPTVDPAMMTTIRLPLATGSLKPLIRKPKHVDDPNFEFIAISHPLNIVQARLRIREFVLRFEKKFNLITKYMRIINDPNSEWTDLTYKNLITRLLVIIQSDENPPLGADLTYEAVKTIQSTSADSPAIWTITKELIDTELQTPEMEDISNNEAYKLDIVCWLIELVIGTTTIRKLIDDGIAQEKKNHQNAVDEIKRLRAEWEEQRQIFQKERLCMVTTGKPDFDLRYAAAHNANKELILKAEQHEWYLNRKLTPRTAPLGVDTLGNTYYLFHQRDRKEEDWGQWIVVEKGSDLPHPSGVLPPPPSMPSDSGLDPDAPELPQLDDEDTIKERMWYCVDQPDDIRHLAEWIKFKGEMAIYWQEIAKQQPRPMTPVSSVPGSPMPMSPSRRLLEAVRVPATIKKKKDDERVVNRDEFMPLIEKLKKTAAFMEIARK
ncbi:hypothetical protein BDD12DRAFT_837908 [Trichophaea hybrida]|nr:hypothetical protein BDD12DRAFT_837908 [Trichophaea hybrida]